MIMLQKFCDLAKFLQSRLPDYWGFHSERCHTMNPMQSIRDQRYFLIHHNYMQLLQTIRHYMLFPVRMLNNTVGDTFKFAG